jgi:hypothetical protein
MTSGSTQQPAPPDYPPGREPVAAENAKRGNIVATLGTIRELLTNVVGIVTVLVSAAATFGVGAAVGNQTASPGPAPVTTVYRTVTPSVAPSPTTTVADIPSTTPPGTPTPAAADGTVLGTYTVDLGFGHSIPLGPDQPAQADFSTAGLGDLGTAAPADHLVFVPINGDRMLSLDAGATPSFAACAADTVFATQADSKPGTAFCMIENGMMAGVKVTSARSAYVVLSVTVWQHTS